MSHSPPPTSVVAQRREPLLEGTQPPTVVAKAPVHAGSAKVVRFADEQNSCEQQEIPRVPVQPPNSVVARREELNDMLENASSSKPQGQEEIQKPNRQDGDKMNVFLFKKENFKVAAAVGLNPATLASHPVVVDTGAGPNCVRLGALPPHAVKKIRRRDGCNVVDANGKPLAIAGTITMYVRIGRCQVKAEFLVCNFLQVPFLIGTDYIRQHVRAILPMDGKIVMKDDSEVEILSRVGNEDLSKVDLTPLKLDSRVRRPNAIRAYKSISLPPLSQTWVRVVTRFPGGVTIEPNSSLAEHGIVVANGVADVQPGVPFSILVANLRNKTILVKKKTLLARAREHPTWIQRTAIPLELLLTGEVGTDTCENTETGTTANPEKQLEDQIGNVDLSKFPTGLHDKARAILAKHQSMWNGKLGTIETTEHRMELLPEHAPVWQAPYRMGHKEREFESAEIGKMLKDGIIRPSKSDWASPVVLAPKGDGSLRFCIDYRAVNEATRRDSYPIPRMDDCIDTLGEARYFSTLDANSGYWQIPMRKKDIPITAFTSHEGLYEFVRMPFGLKNAPATFQRALDMILSGYNWKTCLVYIDDVIIYSRTGEDHLRDVDSVLQVLKQAGVSLKFDKCRFFTDSVRYLGHIIRPGTLEVDDSHVRALKLAKPPKTTSELRSFLGFTNVYRRFINNYTETARPLFKLLQGNPKKHKPIPPLDDSQMKSFQKLIEQVTSPPVLALPQPGLRYSLDTDACDYQIGCALFQIHEDGTRRPIGFWSRLMLPREQNYMVTEKECLAVIYGIITCRHYLLGVEFDLNTDHSSLRWLMTINDPSGRLMRWRIRLSEFQFKIHHKKGYLNTQADTVSRLASDGHTSGIEDFEIPTYSSVLAADSAGIPDQISVTEILREQSRDDFCNAIRSRLERGEGSVSNFKLNSANGVLERILPTHTVTVIPKNLQARLLKLEHEPVIGSHCGGKRMYESMRRYYYWPRMALDCYETVEVCAPCAQERVTLQKSARNLKPFPATAPLEDVAMDMLGPLLKTPRGNRFILVIVDRFTKLTVTVPMKDTRSFDIAKAFVNHWVFVYGPPRTILTDNAGNFRSKWIQEVHRRLGIKSKSTTTYHPQSNGQTERFNKTLLSALRKYVSDHPYDWDLYTHALTYAYNTHVNTVTGLCPFDLVLSRTPLPVGMETEPTGALLSHRQARMQWMAKLGIAIASSRKRFQTAQARTKRNFDSRRRGRYKRIEAGNFVYLRKEKSSSAIGERHKLAKLADGPYEVVQVKPNTVVLQRDNEREEVNIDRVEVTRTPTSHRQFADASTHQGVRDGDEDYIMDKLVEHHVNEDGSMEFKVKWVGSDEHTWEPVAHLPYSAIARYCTRKKIPLPVNMGEARNG